VKSKFMILILSFMELLSLPQPRLQYIKLAL